MDAQRTRAKTLVEMARKSTPFFAEKITLDESAAKKHLRGVVLEPLSELRDKFAGQQSWDGTALQAVVEAVAERHELKLGKVAQPLRVAVTGSAASPGIDVTLELVGKTRCIERLDQALEYIRARVATA